MSTPVGPLMAQIATLWEALTPPDQTTETYRQIDNLETETGYNRNFTWDFAIREGTVAEGGDGQTASVAWTLRAELFITTTGRNAQEMVVAVADEVNLLVRTVERQTSWPSGVIEVVTDRVDEFNILPTGDVIVTMVIRTVVEETD